MVGTPITQEQLSVMARDGWYTDNAGAVIGDEQGCRISFGNTVY